jgi:hypothetical protein
MQPALAARSGCSSRSGTAVKTSVVPKIRVEEPALDHPDRGGARRGFTNKTGTFTAPAHHPKERRGPSEDGADREGSGWGSRASGDPLKPLPPSCYQSNYPSD